MLYEVERIFGTTELFIARDLIGRRRFKVDLHASIGDSWVTLSFRRPFVSEGRLWIVLEDGKRPPSAEMAMFQVESVRIEITKEITTGQLSIVEAVFKAGDGSAVRVFGSVDDFEVPCVCTDLIF